MITQKEYQQRRTQLAKKLPKEAIAIISGSKERPRNGDTYYRFRQGSDFYYFTGFNEPDTVLLIAGTGESYLFNRKKNLQLELWTGRRLGQEQACQTLGVTEAYPYEEFPTRLPQLLAGKSAIYYNLTAKSSLKKSIFNAINALKKQIRQGITAPETLSDIEPLISEMRLFKSNAEIQIMRRANEISIAAHKRAMRACPKLANEYELEAELMYEFMRHGCRSVAYDCIVGGGANACILHYTENDKPLKKGELVLVDAGGEFENYASDITRTYPISGQFTDDQRQIYNLVLKAQKAGINLIKPGLPWNKIQETMVQILTEGLLELGILKGNLATLIKEDAYKAFYMHNSGHWLGLDVHDSGRYKINKEWRTLQSGMVLTVEPGVYIAANTPGVEKRWWDIGIRIEDDILVTETGFENLTADLPVDADKIEALMRD